MDQAFYAIGAGVIGLGFGVYSLIKLVLAHRWPEAEGTIVSSYKSNRSSDAGRMEDAEITYEYEVGGKLYRSDTIQAGGDISSSPSKRGSTNVDRILIKYPVGTKVTVYHHPRLPQIACLERTDATGVFIGFVFGGLLLLAGYYFFD